MHQSLLYSTRRGLRILSLFECHSCGCRNLYNYRELVDVPIYRDMTYIQSENHSAFSIKQRINQKLQKTKTEYYNKKIIKSQETS